MSRPTPTPAPEQGAARRRGGDERGAASAELAGIIMVIVLFISALAIAAGSGGLGAQYENLLCRAFSWFGTSCSTPPPLASDREPDDACVVTTTSTSRSIGVTVVVDLDQGGTVTLEAMSDGTYRVAADARATLGMGVGAGGGVSVTVDDKKVGALVQAGAGAGLTGSAGAAWTFDNADDAQQLVDFFDRKIANATTPVVGPVKEVFEAGKNLFGGPSYVPPQPTEYMFSAGVTGNASASAVGIEGAATADIGAAVELGAKYDTETNETTVYYSVSYDGSADIRQGLSEASASGEVSGMLAVTISPDGEYLTNVSFETAAYGETGYDAHVMFNSVANGGTAGGVVLNASVDLTDSESTLIAYDLLRASGVKTLPSQYRNPPGSGPEVDIPALSALQRLVEASLKRGEVFRQEVTGSSNTAFGIDASGDFGIGLGLRYDNSSSERSVTGAQYYDGSRWVDWTSCVG